MTKRIEAMDPNLMPVGQMTLSDREIRQYVDMPDLPDGEKGKICEQHLFGDDKASDFMEAFIMEGCDFPTGDAEPIVRTRFVCPGPSLVKKCRLKMLQADRDGNVLNEGKLR